MTTLGRGCLLILPILLGILWAWYRRSGYVGDPEPDYSLPDPYVMGWRW